MASERFPLKNLRALPAQLRFRRAGLAGFCGAAFGLALARYLFESQPQRLSFLSTWPGALLLAIACGSAALRFGLRQIVSGRLSGGPFLALLLPLLSLLAPDVNLLRAQTLLLGALVLFTLLVLTAESAESAEKRDLGCGMWDVGFSLFLFLFLFLLYLLTLAPAVGEADTFEFQVGIARLGVAHGSGYPLLMLLGKLFTLLPVGGTLAFRANLTSAFFGALAGVGVERLARRLGCAPLTALLAGFTFGVSPTLWSRAVEVEAYTLNAVLVAAILYLLLMLVNGSSSVIREASRAQRVGRLPSSVYLLAFLFGLSLTNHLTTLVLTPACLVATLMAASRRRWPMADGRWPMANSTSASGSASHSPRAAVTRSGHASFVIRHSSFVILSLLLGLSVYLYLPLRWPAVNHGEQLSWAQFVNILSGSEARGAFQWALPFQDFNRYEILFRKIVGEYGWAGLALAVLGGAALLVRPSSHPPPSTPHREASPWDPPPFSLHPPLILALAYLGYAYFALAFNVPDPDFSAFLIPLHLIAAVLMGLGLNALLGLAHNFSARLQNRDSSFVTRSGHLSFAILHLSFALLPFRSLWLTLPRVDQSQDWDKYRLGLEILSRLPPQRVGHATILADSERIAPLYYLQVAEGVRPDPDIVVLPDEASYRAALDERLAAGQTVYLARYLP
ncbi:MAG: glycosyltransferase family 117 protein, partial [Anaerolineales bacterium]